jgi:hypothetical protein
MRMTFCMSLNFLCGHKKAHQSRTGDSRLYHSARPEESYSPCHRHPFERLTQSCRFMRLMKQPRFPASWNQNFPLSPTRRMAGAFCAGGKLHFLSSNSSSRSLDNVGLANYPCKKYALWRPVRQIIRSIHTTNPLGIMGTAWHCLASIARTHLHNRCARR